MTDEEIRKESGLSRRGFLSGLTALVGGIALEQAIPFGRVWSFPSKIVIPQGIALNLEQVNEAHPVLYQPKNELLTIGMITAESLKVLEENLVWLSTKDRELQIVSSSGKVERIFTPKPVRYLHG
jgi:hypothetical protein